MERRRLGRLLEESRETPLARCLLVDRTVVDRDASEVDARVVLGVGVGELVVLLVVTLVCGLPALATFVVLALTIVDTVRREGRWGINFKGATCPQCHSAAPTMRVPKNARQALWGGWTCTRCQLEIDKWGKPIRDR